MSALAGKLREVTGKSATRKIRTEESMPAGIWVERQCQYGYQPQGIEETY